MVNRPVSIESVNMAEILDERDASETDNGDISTKISSTGKRSRDLMWKGQYCCVPLCHNASGRSAEQRQFGSVRISFQICLQTKKGLKNGLLKYDETLDQIL